MTTKMPIQVEKVLEQSYYKTEQKLFLFRQNALWKAVIKTGSWTTLKQLYLMYCEIESSEILTVISQQWPCLQVLSFQKNIITSDGIQYLTSRFWPSLTTLTLNNNNIKWEGFSKLMKSKKNLPILQLLYLERNQIQFINLKQIVNQNLLNQIKILTLSENGAGNNLAKMLSRIDLRELKMLQIYDCKIIGTGMGSLSKISFNNLSIIQLGDWYLNYEGCEFLNKFQLSYLTKLQLMLKKKDIGYLLCNTINCNQQAEISYFRVNEFIQKDLNRALSKFQKKKKINA